MGKLERFVGSALHIALNINCLLGIVSSLSMLSAALFLAEPSVAQTVVTPQHPALPSETPARFEPKTDSFDYVRREVMIPMRDGVKLYTVILAPKNAKDAPILLTRMPRAHGIFVRHKWRHQALVRRSGVNPMSDTVPKRRAWPRACIIRFRLPDLGRFYL